MENPTVIYATPGTYDVTLIVTNTAGADTVTLSNYIMVQPLPTAGFNSSVNGSTASFTNTSVNATSYSWDFGDNNTSNDPNPIHTYATDGTYTVTLQATNNCGTVTFTGTVVIETPPSANFSANTTSGCDPLTVQFMNQSSEICDFLPVGLPRWNTQFFHYGKSNRDVQCTRYLLGHPHRDQHSWDGHLHSDQLHHCQHQCLLLVSTVLPTGLR